MPPKRRKRPAPGAEATAAAAATAARVVADPDAAAHTVTPSTASATSALSPQLTPSGDKPSTTTTTAAATTTTAAATAAAAAAVRISPPKSTKRRRRPAASPRQMSASDKHYAELMISSSAKQMRPPQRKHFMEKHDKQDITRSYECLANEHAVMPTEHTLMHFNELTNTSRGVIKEYYQRQTELINDLMAWRLKLVDWAEEAAGDDARMVELLDTQNTWRPLVRGIIYTSFGLNVVLFAGKAVAAIVTRSIALAASALDSALDLFSGLVIFLTSWLMRRTNPYKFPAGKSRLEPIGIIIFSSVMGTATLFVIIQAVGILAAGESDVDWSMPALAFLGAVIGVKLLLFVAAWATNRCFYANRSVQALAMDHRNDVLSNGFVMIASLVVRFEAAAWWLDPACAIAVSCFIIYVWGKLALETMAVLSGTSAPTTLLNKLTYVCLMHRPDKVLAIDTVRAFHLSYGFLVEVDILLPKDMPLSEAHDIGEELQFKLERLEEVERAFVHLDHEIDHEPEHKPLSLPYHLQKKKKKGSSKRKTPVEK